MTIFEIEKLLPNGFHDSSLHSVEINYEDKKAIFIITPLTTENDEDLACEDNKIKLILTGVKYLTIEPPDPNYPFLENKPLWIDLSDNDKDFILSKFIDKNDFTGRFFVNDWNSFIHIAAENAEFQKI